MMKKILSAIFAAAIMLSAFPLAASADKWVQTDSGYVYKYDNGKTAEKGWLKVDGKTYYIKKDGTRQTGWLKTKTAKYYFDKNGAMKRSQWVTMTSGKKYYFLSNGKAATGIVDIKSGKKTVAYKFDSDGVCLGENYHFILNTDSLCLHSIKCRAAKKIDKDNYDEIDLGKNEFKEYSENGYWACGVSGCNAPEISIALPKSKKSDKSKK